MTPLQQRIIERIQREGPIPFADYMRMALYEPGQGYYVTGQTRIGWEGDYYTSTDIADFFANCMGRQLQHMWEKLGKPDPFIVLEQGAGRGDLASGVRAWAARQAPDLYAALAYRTEDIHLGIDVTSDTSTPEHPQMPEYPQSPGRPQGDALDFTFALGSGKCSRHPFQRTGGRLSGTYCRGTRQTPV